MKKKETLQTEKVENEVVALIVRIVVAIAVIILVVVVYNSFFNKNEYADLTDSSLVETKDGYKKEYEFETVVKSKKVYNEKNGKVYKITCYDKKEKFVIEVGNYKYNKLDIDEKIKVTGVSYYDKKGLHLSSTFEVVSLEKEDDNGIIDIPDGYKEPEPERVPGADYGDGIEY